MATLLSTSERIYGWLLHLYPRGYQQEFAQEMQYVFGEQLAESYHKEGASGVITLWIRTIFDAVKTICIEHLESNKGAKPMKKTQDLLMSNQAFGWLAAGTGTVLLIPLIGMQLSSEWNWGLFDFLLIGTLLYGAGSIFILLARKFRTSSYRLILALLVLFAVLWLWAELAVGIFTNWGS